MFLRTVLVSFFFAFSAFAAQPLTVGAINPAGWWMPRHQALLQKAKNERVEVYFLGDSITEQWAYQGLKVWDQSLAPLFSSNFGIGGDGIQQVLWRIQHGEFASLTPKVLVLMIGTNNLWSHSAKEITAGHVALIREIRKQLPKTKILLLGIFPRLDDGAIRDRLKIGPINEALRMLADGKSIFYMNLNANFVAGSISPRDGVHLTEKGYQIWADVMTPELKRLLQ